jgi:ADP-ribose pyrophosphatase YjhB (NUDIX family)
MLSIPGGFVDIGETAEDGLRRELREEVNLEVTALEFLCTQPNVYHYQGVTYPVLDLFFVTEAVPGHVAAALEDVESLCWLDPAEVAPEEIAFPSVREGLRRFLAGRAS